MEVSLATTDCQLFNGKIMDLVSTQIPRNRFKYLKGRDVCKLKVIIQHDRYGLEHKLKPSVVDVSNDDQLKNISTFTNLCHCETERETIYNLIASLNLQQI